MLQDAERQDLLNCDDDSQSEGESDQVSRVSCDTHNQPGTIWWRREAKRMFHVGGMASLILAGRLAMLLTDIAMLGHLSADNLAAAATGTIWINVTTFFIWRGLASVLKTFCSAALGSRNYKQVGQWLQVSLAIGAGLAVLIAILWSVSYYVFFYIFGLGDHDASLAAKYVHYSMTWIVPTILFAVFNSYFQAMNIVAPAVVAVLVWAGINVALNLFFIWGMPGTSFNGLGFVGSPIATAVCRWGQAITYIWYMIWYRRYHESTWSEWSYDVVFRSGKMTQYMKLMAPLTLASFLEEAQLQTIAVLAVRLGKDEISAHTTLINLLMFLSSALMGLRAAVNVRASYYMGRGSLKGAKLVAKLGLAAVFIVAAVVCSALLACRDSIGKLFTSEKTVDDLIEQVLMLMCGAYLLLGLMLVGLMIFTTARKAGMVAVFFLVGCWCVGVPLAYVLGFTLNHGLMGIWEAMSAGYTVVLLLAGIALFHVDWQAATDKVHALACEGAAEGTADLPAAADDQSSSDGSASQC